MAYMGLIHWIDNILGSILVLCFMIRFIWAVTRLSFLATGMKPESIAELSEQDVVSQSWQFFISPFLVFCVRSFTPKKR